MKRFLISSPKFTGEAELFYNTDGILCKIDCTETSMDENTITRFKNSVPAGLSKLQESFSPTTVIVEADFEVTFDMFWKKYDKKINKSRCIMLWCKLSKSMQVLAFYGITPYYKFLKKEGEWRKPVDPENYLRNKYWENEYK